MIRKEHERLKCKKVRTDVKIYQTLFHQTTVEKRLNKVLMNAFAGALVYCTISLSFHMCMRIMLASSSILAIESVLTIVQENNDIDAF